MHAVWVPKALKGKDYRYKVKKCVMDVMIIVVFTVPKKYVLVLEKQLFPNSGNLVIEVNNGNV